MSRSRLASRVAALKEGMVPALSAAHSDRACDGTLIAGEVLAAGHLLSDPTHQYSVLMGHDGDLAICRTPDATQTWASHTGGNAHASLVMRDDGRLAVVALDGECLGSSPTGGNPGAFAQLHEDGQLVIHSFYRDVLWSSSDLARSSPVPSGGHPLQQTENVSNSTPDASFP